MPIHLGLKPHPAQSTKSNSTTSHCRVINPCGGLPSSARSLHFFTYPCLISKRAHFIAIYVRSLHVSRNSVARSLPINDRVRSMRAVERKKNNNVRQPNDSIDDRTLGAKCCVCASILYYYNCVTNY